jgi:hypothetical protein
MLDSIEMMSPWSVPISAGHVYHMAVWHTAEIGTIDDTLESGLDVEKDFVKVTATGS